MDSVGILWDSYAFLVIPRDSRLALAPGSGLRALWLACHLDGRFLCVFRSSGYWGFLVRILARILARILGRTVLGFGRNYLELLGS